MFTMSVNTVRSQGVRSPYGTPTGTVLVLVPVTWSMMCG
jgi:hypothetical protein